MELEQTCRFRSDFYHDLKLHREFNRGTRDGRLFYRVIYLYIIGIFIWFFWYCILRMDAAEVYFNAALVMCGIWVLVEGVWFLMTRGGGIHFKRSLMLNGGKPTNDSVLFCDDHILTLERESGNRATILYDNIRSVCETENLLLFGLRYSTYLMVDKRSLTGTKEELGQFLYEKCPKLRRKKVRNCKWGKLLRRIAWAVVFLSFVIALWYHPVLQIDHRLNGQIHNGMSAMEIAAELEGFGLSMPDSDQLRAVDEEYHDLHFSKLENLLLVTGMGIHDSENLTWTPAETGVFFTYYWGTYPETMYEDFLRGVSAMSRGEIIIENIREDWSHADWANYDGFVTVDFTLNGEEKQIEAVFYEEWYDEQTFSTLNTMVWEATGKQLYFADYDDVGCFIFLGYDAWAERFMDRTGLTLSPDINEIY